MHYEKLDNDDIERIGESTSGIQNENVTQVKIEHDGIRAETSQNIPGENSVSQIRKKSFFENSLEETNDEDHIEVEADNIPILSSTLEDITWKMAIPQILFCCIIHTIAIQTGISMSFSAVLLPQLNKTGSDIHITTAEGSWIASLVTISLTITALFVGSLIDKFGRKKISIATTIPYIISWLLIANAKNVWYIYCSRVLAGIGGGLATSCLIYVSEITHPSFRPMLLGVNSVFVSLGILLTCLFGYWLHWRTISYINCGLILFPLIFLIFAPESPYWLIVFKDDIEGTSKSLHRLYGNETVYQNQYQNLAHAKLIYLLQYKDRRENSKWDQFKNEIKAYLQPIVYKPLLMLCIIFLFQQLSGAYVIIFYAVQLFSKLNHELKSSLDPNTSFILLGVIRFVMSIVSSIASKRFGRRPLLILSGLGMTIFMLVAGIIIVPFNLTVSTRINNNIIALYCVLGYICSSSLASFVIPWSLIGELLPIKVRGKLGGFIVGLAYLFMFGTVKVFPFILEAFNVSYIFYAFCFVSLVGVIHIYLFLPETLGKSFAEIERHFQPTIL